MTALRSHIVSVTSADRHDSGANLPKPASLLRFIRIAVCRNLPKLARFMGRGARGPPDTCTLARSEIVPLMGTVRHVKSDDGTSIGYRTTGDGPALVLVHGAGTDSGDWYFVSPLLSSRFTVVTMDRRGRGESGDGVTYTMERETEDLLAVLDAVEAEFLVGHSYGGLCAMNAAALTDRLNALVVYEPPVSVTDEFAAATRAKVESDGPDDTLTHFLRGAGMTEEQLVTVRDSRAWPGLVATVPLLPRELEAAAAWMPPPEGTITARSLYLLGSETTNQAYLRDLEAAQRAFTNLSTARLPGQLHVGHVFDARQFAEAIGSFLLS